MNLKMNKKVLFLPRPPAYFSECHIKIDKFENPNYSSSAGGGPCPTPGGL